MKHQWILIRHAHRDIPADEGHAADNGLSEKGHAQARERVSDLKPFLTPQVQLWSSPKLRCLETLTPLADALGQKIVPRKELLERQSDEDDRAWLARVRNALHHYGAIATAMKPPTWVFCSHGDWLPVALQILTGVSEPFRKSHGVVLEMNPNGRDARSTFQVRARF